MKLYFCFAIASLAPFAHSQFDPTSHPNWRLVNDNSCGIRGQTRIIGARQAGLGEFPWMVLVRMYETDGGHNTCGGSIINENYVITAAHCVFKLDPAAIIKLRFGEYHLTQDPDCEKNVCAPNHIEYDAIEIQIHPDFRPNVNGSGWDPLGDLALVRSQQRLNFTDFIRPICLEYGNLLNQNYSVAEVIGWGALYRLYPGLSYPDRLQKATVPVLDDVTCARWLSEFKTTPDRHKPSERHICAGNQTTYSYLGDSGSPMFIAEVVGGDIARNYLIAITATSFSFTFNLGGPRPPSIYARVAPHLKWILDVIHD